MRVLIAGAGIGGLTTALALHARGIEVHVCEAVEALQPLGVGINILPHAMAVLAELGVADEIAALGVKTRRLLYANRHGQTLWSEPRGLAAGYPVPQISIHRGRLQQALLASVRQRLGADAVRCGLRLEGFEAAGPRGVRVWLASRAGGRVQAELADVLVAADGIHSEVRRRFYPDEGPPRWSGAILWRATSLAPPFLDGETMLMAGSKRQKFVAYPIRPAGPDGRCEINWVAELDLTGSPPRAREDWNRRGDLADFLPVFEAWRLPFLDVAALIRTAEAVYEFPMVDRDPLPRWSFGRVTLLGDAAHPMYPIGSNGASQAILDARALADALAEERDPGAALTRYESLRRPATAAIVHSNRRMGPELILQLAEERAPDGFEHVEDVFAPGELEEIAARYKAIAGFEPGQVGVRRGPAVDQRPDAGRE
jgi:2-polyprenyl-6-methoxyphenol hydroxylase-like FAD-dependent oxidoreductase